MFLSYVPWALVCDFRTAKEVRQEWERIRKVRRGEEGVGESTLEDKGKKNRWRSDRAWQEVLFLSLQGACWLGESSPPGYDDTTTCVLYSERRKRERLARKDRW